MSTFPKLVDRTEIGKPVNLTNAYELSGERSERIRVYPASMELRDNKTYALKSRAICVVGIGESVQIARETSLEGVNAIKGGALWHRTDIASKKHIEKSIRHMEKLRRSKQ
jgi:phosphoribosylamine-glycine ligase